MQGLSKQQQILKLVINASLIIFPIAFGFYICDAVSEAFERSGGSHFVSFFICSIITMITVATLLAHGIYIEGQKEQKTYSSAWDRVYEMRVYLAGFYALGIASYFAA